MARILVVDDSRPRRDALVALLHTSGHETVAAENGAVGLARLVSETPDAVLVELTMAVLDGFAFLAGLSGLDRAAPAVVTTGEALDEVRERCLALGAVDVLERPLTEAKLRRSLAAALGDSRPG